MSFIHTESNMHRAAKEVVAGWLREITPVDDYCSLPPVHSRPNRSGPMRGIYLEYPIGFNREGLNPVWDESIWLPGGPIEDYCPTVEELSARNIRVACVCDIAILHKGNVFQVIEIVHKHPTPRWKLDFLRRHDVEVIEISAKAVMHMCNRPTLLPLYIGNLVR